MPRYNYRIRSSTYHRVSGSEVEPENHSVESEYAPKSDPSDLSPGYPDHINSNKKGYLTLIVMIAIAIISICGGYYAAISTPYYWRVAISKSSEPNIHLDPTVIPSPTSPITPTSSPQILTNNGSPPIQIYQKLRESVVMIYVGEDRQGSGILSANGIIVTNAHVVRGQTQVKVKSAWGKTYIGTVSVVNPDVDLAVVRIDSDRTLPCVIFSNRPLIIGESVYALSNPWGMESTFTNGMVSRIDSNGNILHTAVIAPGSSGSPLLDKDGKVIGINQAVRSDLAVYISIPASATAILPMQPFCPSP